MGPTSPTSVGGGVFEFGFSFKSAVFSGPGSLADLSASAFWIFVRCCALAATPASAAVASAELRPNIFLLDKPPNGPASSFSLLIVVSPFVEHCWLAYLQLRGQELGSDDAVQSEGCKPLFLTTQ